MKSGRRLRRTLAGVLAAGALLTGAAGAIGAGIALSAAPANATPEEDCAAVRARDHQIYLNLIASLPPGAPIPPEIINPCLSAPSTTSTAAPTTTVGLPGVQAPGGGPNVGANAPTNFPTYNGTPIVPVPTIEVPPVTSESPASETGVGAFPNASASAVPSPTPTPGEGTTTDRGPGPIPADSDSNIAPAQTVPVPAADVSTAGEDSGRDRYLELTLIGAAAFTAAGIGVRGRPGPFSPRTPESVLSQAVGTAASPLTAYAPGGQSSLRVFDPITGGSRFFFLIHDETSSHESVIPVAVPPGGHMSVNQDGTVTVFDADGNPVSTIDAPWAYDANGTPIPTHYEIRDGQLVQVVDTTGIENVLYPISADPQDRTQSGKKSPAPARPTKISGEDDGTRSDDGPHWNETPQVEGHKAPNPPVQKPIPTQPPVPPAVEPEPQVPEQAPAQVPEQIPQRSPAEDISGDIGGDGPGAGTSPSIDPAPATPNETDTPQAELAGIPIIGGIFSAAEAGLMLTAGIAALFAQILAGVGLGDSELFGRMESLEEWALEAGVDLAEVLVKAMALLSPQDQALLRTVLSPFVKLPPAHEQDTPGHAQPGPAGPAAKPPPRRPTPRPVPRLPGDHDPTQPQDPSSEPDSGDPATPSDPGFEPPVDPGTTAPGLVDPEQPSAPEPGEQPAVDPVNPGHIPVDPETPGAPTQPGPPEFDPFDPDPSTIADPTVRPDPTERSSVERVLASNFIHAVQEVVDSLTDGAETSPESPPQQSSDSGEAAPEDSRLDSEGNPLTAADLAQLYASLRRKTPTNVIRDIVNLDHEGGGPDPVLPGLTLPDVLEADHTVPMRVIFDMPGFTQLTFEQQIQVLNYVDNFLGLSPTANTSKGAKSWADWWGYVKGGIPVSPEFRDAMIEIETHLTEEIRQMISSILNGVQ